MIKKDKVFRVGDRPFIVSATLPSQGESLFWYVFDGEMRHYQLISLGIVRAPDSLIFTATIFVLLLAIAWPATNKVVTE